jgi:hypothetical protein
MLHAMDGHWTQQDKKTERNPVDKWPNKGNKSSTLQDRVLSSKLDKLQICFGQKYVEHINSSITKLSEPLSKK